MSVLERATDRVDRVVTFLGRTVEMALLAGVLVVVFCVMTLVVCATYATLHKGDDFGNIGGGHGGGDVIVLHGVL